MTTLTQPIFIRQTAKLVQASLRTRYRGTWSGFLWVILLPIFTFGAQSYAFHYILKMDVEHYPLFLLTGLLPWIFISQSLDMSATSLLNNAKMLKSFPISPYAIVLSQITDNFINYLAAFIVLIIPIKLWLDWPLGHLIYMIVPLISLFIFVTSASFLLSAINVLYRDTKFILSFFLSIAFFMTPIFYPVDFIPPNMRWVADYNVFYSIIRPIQILSTQFSMDDYWQANLKSYLTSITLAVFTIYYWRKKRNAIFFIF
ncbi:MAG: ABC transporter permease [Bdellovibrionales bacterium]|nr:ABC transporter permease [Bdellovibrionales bacterium]